MNASGGEWEKPRLNVAVIGNYLPRQCGIATFTYDLATWLSRNLDPSSDVFVVAMNDRVEGYDYPPVVRFEILASNHRDYPRAADYINLSGVDIVCLQHEFGIFGGPRGIYITDLLRELEKPVVTTIHTVLSDPDPERHRALVEVCDLSDAIIVMSEKSVEFLKEYYQVDTSKVHMIHHGAQDFPFVKPDEYKGKWGLSGKTVLLTFGLLSARKGIEYMIQAMPKIIERYPDCVYVVLGATHPPAKKKEGERYRFSLKGLARELGVEDHVLFYERFVSLEELIEFLAACDIYVTPYIEKDQIVSGTLAYALTVGRPVVSTPYYYAQEMLAGGRGLLADFKNPDSLADAVLKLLSSPELRNSMMENAYSFGRKLIWKEIAKEYIRLFESVLAGRKVAVVPSQARPHVSFRDIPRPKLDYLARLTDSTGVLSRAHYDIPDRASGYDAGENALALAATVLYRSQTDDENAAELARRYLGFLRYMQTPEGKFHGRLSYDLEFTDDVGDEECQGKVLAGLGVTVALEQNEGLASLAKNIFDDVVATLELAELKAMAYAICGCYHYLTRFPGASHVAGALENMAEKLNEAFERESSSDWRWFEESLRSGNGVLPRALLLSYRATKRDEFLKNGVESLSFLTELCYKDGIFDLIGDYGFFAKEGERARFRQLPVEAASLVDAYVDAYVIESDEKYLELARAAMEWFLGRNILRQPLYDFAQGSCSDGLLINGIDPNRGASSTIYFLLALLRMSTAVHVEVIGAETSVS